MEIVAHSFSSETPSTFPVLGALSVSLKSDSGFMQLILFVRKPLRILLTSELRNLNVCVYIWMSTCGSIIGSGDVINAGAQRAFQVACFLEAQVSYPR